jgi:hypothetical protein
MSKPNTHFEQVPLKIVKERTAELTCATQKFHRCLKSFPAATPFAPTLRRSTYRSLSDRNRP